MKSDKSHFLKIFTIFLFVCFYFLPIKANDSFQTLLERLDTTTRNLSDEIIKLNGTFDNFKEQYEKFRKEKQQEEGITPKELAKGKENLKHYEPESKEERKKSDAEEAIEKRRKAMGEEELPAPQQPKQPIKPQEPIPPIVKPQPLPPIVKPQPLPPILIPAYQKELNAELESLVKKDLTLLEQEIKNIDEELQEIEKQKKKKLTRAIIDRKNFLTEKKEYIEMLISLKNKTPETLKNELGKTRIDLATLGTRQILSADAVRQKEIDKLERKVKFIEAIIGEEEEKEEESEWD